MGTPNLQLTINLAALAAAFGSLAALVRAGALRERVLASGPKRDLGLGSGLYAAGAGSVLLYALMVVLERESDSPALSLLSTFLPLFIVGLFLGRLVHAPGGLEAFGVKPAALKRDLRWGLVALPVSLAFVWAVGLGMFTLSRWLGLPVQSVGHESLQHLSDSFSIEALLGLILTAVIIAPVLEELVFRGVLQTCLLRLLGGHRWATLIYAAMLFSIIHAWVVPWQSLVSLFVLGLVFGYLYERTGSLLVAVLTHALFNASNIAITLMLPMGSAGG